MDPITIAGIVLKTTTTCITTTKYLYGLQSMYKDAPMAVISICSESTVICASLSQIQSLLLRRQDLADSWKAQAELPKVLDVALTGCMVIFSCLDSELQKIVAGVPDSSQIRWRSRVRMMWNEARLNELLNALRGQQTTINLLIQLLQMDTLSEIKQMLQQKQDLIGTSIQDTEFLRAENPAIRIATSIYDSESEAGSICSLDTASIVAPSDLEFEFDDIIINSQVYRQLLAQAQAKPIFENVEEVGDLIDFTDDATVRQEESSVFSFPAVMQDLEGLSLHGPSKERDLKESEDEPAAEGGEFGASRTMFFKALEQANTAVLLDKAQNYEGAMEAYSGACAVLEEMRSNLIDEDKRKLEAIRNTYMSRISVLLRLTRPRNDSDTLPWSPENGEAFKVKAVLGYTSPHDDDLHFSDGQIIRVTNQEDEEWYMGEYMDASGVKHEGTSPKHFVEKYGL